MDKSDGNSQSWIEIILVGLSYFFESKYQTPSDGNPRKLKGVRELINFLAAGKGRVSNDKGIIKNVLSRMVYCAHIRNI